MKDKEIRAILVEYLKFRHRDCRIYHEKSIGSAVCDVMLVTDRLTGFEIKSDSDNFERLPRQITAYNQYFDENYLVVGSSHSKIAASHIPREWGILEVDCCGIKELRAARRNLTVQRIKQLSILWRIELKGILLLNHMPLYAQKSKAYICERIAAEVPDDILGQQIAGELMSRDYSLYGTDNRDAEDNVLANHFPLPLEEMIDCLSEEDLSRFSLDRWMSIYRQASERQRLKAQISPRIKDDDLHTLSTANRIRYSDISVRLGVPWISEEIITEFAIDVLHAPQQYYYRFDPITRKHCPDRKIPIVQREKLTGYWHVEKYTKHRIPEMTAIYGTHRFNAMQILECTLNLRRIAVRDGTEYNEEETLAALEKQKALQDAFPEWIWKDDDRCLEIENAYNRLFAEYEPAKYDGGNIEFEGMAADINLYNYQRNAVQKIISTPNTLLAFDVGTGKTYIMIAAAMEMRRSGLSRKNMFVVPNNITGQWEAMFIRLYPKARVLTVDPHSFTPEKRHKVLCQIQREDYDGIIIAYSCFEQITLSTQYLLDNMHRSLNGFDSRIMELRGKYFPGAASSIKHEMDYIRKSINDLVSCIDTTPADISFDQLEINTLFVDEAHNFKNIPLRTTMKHLRGINTVGSRRCSEMLRKVRYVQESNGGRGAVFATGTPLCNSISDTYAMQCYLQYDELRKKGFDRFDDWVKTFSYPEEICEIDVDTSGFRFVQRFRGFFNLPELSRMFGMVSIFHSADKDGMPILSDRYDVVTPKSSELDDYMKELYHRTEAIRAGAVDRKSDNMLKVSTDGRKAALSLALVGREEHSGDTSKLRRCAQNVLDIYTRFPCCSQIIFCDYSTPKNTGFSVYNELRQHLIESGVSPKEIAFIHSCRSEEQRLRLFDDVNSGAVRILIGSTFKLGIGANVQTRLKAIHHLDVPWRPADMIQREGRILRQGNLNEKVSIFRYITEGSFDSYSWQILQTKQHFISQFLSGTALERSIDDFESDELNYAQVKAVALGDPLMKEYAETENQLRRTRMLLRQENSQREHIKLQISELTDTIGQLHTELHTAEANAAYIEANLPAIREGISLIVQSVSVRLTRCFVDGADAFIGEFKVLYPNEQSERKRTIILERLCAEYSVEVSTSAVGNRTRLTNFFSRFGEQQVQRIRADIAETECRKEELRTQFGLRSQTPGIISELEHRLSELFDRISKKH